MHRSAQHKAETAAAEESQRLRRAAAQEALLKETFLEAVVAEKERLLLARDQALQHRPSSSSSAPQVGSRLSLTHHRAHGCIFMLSLSGEFMQLWSSFGACVSADPVQSVCTAAAHPLTLCVCTWTSEAPVVLFSLHACSC